MHLFFGVAIHADHVIFVAVHVSKHIVFRILATVTTQAGRLIGRGVIGRGILGAQVAVQADRFFPIREGGLVMTILAGQIFVRHVSQLFKPVFCTVIGFLADPGIVQAGCKSFCYIP